ncbi:hypothetical protein BGZ63DRAFT_124614 [Mariannaea sp. PMI_226]|nr:hypothetical protein BGZ63DRAFT_124614 [Mariannaea sp. PMI_226]
MAHMGKAGAGLRTSFGGGRSKQTGERIAFIAHCLSPICLLVQQPTLFGPRGMRGCSCGSVMTTIHSLTDCPTESQAKWLNSNGTLLLDPSVSPRGGVPSSHHCDTICCQGRPPLSPWALAAWHPGILALAVAWFAKLDGQMRGGKAEAVQRIHRWHRRWSWAYYKSHMAHE